MMLIPFQMDTLDIPQYKYKIAFVTNQGAFTWVVMPFGVKNGPPAYQKVT
jgi:hypothetical protein